MHWLLDRLVNDTDRRVIDADLAELHEIRRRLDGDRIARRWLGCQQRAYPLHLLGDRVHAAIAERKTTMPYLWRDISYSVRNLAPRA